MMDKKELIMNKAMELFAKQGFEATSVQQITEECGISKGAFYLSFHSKKELIMTLIDHFMVQLHKLMNDIVNNTDKEHVLYTFYYETYQYFSQHIDFAKFFLKELPSLSLNNDDLYRLFKSHDKQLEKTILRMLNKVFGPSIEPLKYDLMQCVKLFIGMYGELLIRSSANIDFHLLAKSLTDKTNVLANHMSVPFVTESLVFALEDGQNEPSVEKDN